MSDTAAQFELPDLCDQAGVTVRTVRYYIAQGLLPSPGQTGPGARYGQGHLDRLRLIRKLQREHLPLAEIRRRLEVLSDDEVAALLGDVAPASKPGSALDYVRNVLAGGATASPGPESQGRVHAPRGARSTSMRGTSAQRRAVAASGAAGSADTARDAFPRERAQWERLTLAADVELQVRRPLSREQNRRVERLLEAARQIFADNEQS